MSQILSEAVTGVGVQRSTDVTPAAHGHRSAWQHSEASSMGTLPLRMKETERKQKPIRRCPALSSILSSSTAASGSSGGILT